MATITAAAGGGNSSAGGTWVGGVAPGTSDVARLDATSGNVTLDAALTVQALDCNGYTGTLTLGSQALSIASPGLADGEYRMRFSSGMTLSGSAGATNIGTVDDGETLIDFGGKTLSCSAFSTYDVKLMSAINIADITWSINGTLDTNGQAVYCGFVSISSGATVTLGSSTIQCRYWSATNAHTLNSGTSNIIIRTTNTGLLSPLGKTFNDVTFVRGGAYAIVGANTIGRILLSGAAAATTIRFQHTTTHTLTGTQPFPSGTSGNVLTIESCASNGAPSAGSTATVSYGGAVDCDYLSLKDNTATGGGTFYEGANSTEVSNVSGWLAGDRPAGVARAGVSAAMLLSGSL